MLNAVYVSHNSNKIKCIHKTNSQIKRDYGTKVINTIYATTKNGYANYRAQLSRMRNMPPQDANFGNANKQINNGSYLQQQQQLYGGMQQSPQVYQPQSGTMQKSPYVSQEQIPMQKNQHSKNNPNLAKPKSEPVPQNVTT